MFPPKHRHIPTNILVLLYIHDFDSLHIVFWEGGKLFYIIQLAVSI